jgi:uncharacterized protein YjbJ (UPF0337 family)
MLRLNADIVQGWCRQAVGRARQRWGMLTGRDETCLAGELDLIEGLLLEAYGLRTEHSEAEVDRLLADWRATRQ